MEISKKYLPLFELIYGNHDQVDTVILTGGRLSGKSYGVGVALSEALIQKDWKTLFTRFTNVSIRDSIYSEFVTQLESTGYNEHCNIKQDRIGSKVGTGEIVFKGIKTGSSGQTANLKSLSGFNCFVVDEAEEIPNKETFKKVFYSIRSSDKRNLSILILNPTTKDHWIYKEYFKKKNIKDGFTGIVDNVLYIHTSYLDVNPKFVPENIRKDYEDLRLEDPTEYNSIVLGGWISDAIGKVYSMTKLKRFNSADLKDNLVEYRLGHIDIANEGTDNLAMVVIKVIGRNLYLTDVVFTPEDSTYTEPIVIEMAKENKLEYLWIESNGVGSMYASNIAPSLYSTTVVPYHQSTNKHAKIVSKAGFIKKWMHFRDDYEAGSEYDLFMQNMIEYNKSKKENNSIHDDAIDSLSSAVGFIQEWLYENWL
tara:strand:- start:7229 stop:8497 length:1269 start_codon:yes stop_codon:yes gene_type:complete